MSRTTINGLTVIGLAGHLDVGTVAELRGQLAACRSATLPDLALDLRETEFIDCTVVGAMIAARNRVADAGGCVRLSGARNEPRRMLSLCQLDEVLCVYDTLGEATAAVCARPRRRGRVPATHGSRPLPTAARRAAVSDRAEPQR